MRHITIETAQLAENEKAVAPLKIYDHEEGAIVHLTLKPDAVLPAHKTPVNVAFYVLEGSISIEIGDEAQVFTPDMLIESPKDIPHALTNISSDAIARTLVIKMPRP